MQPSNTFTHTSWLVPQAGVKRSVYIDQSFLNDPMASQRDWNEDIFALLSAPCDDIMSRDRTIMKTQVEFMEAAKALAVAAVDGGLAPVNPLDDVQSHIYIANNLFASRCADNFDAATRFSRLSPPPFSPALLTPLAAAALLKKWRRSRAGHVTWQAPSRTSPPLPLPLPHPHFQLLQRFASAFCN